MCSTLYTESYQTSLKYFSKLSHNTHIHTSELDSANGQSVLVQVFFFPPFHHGGGTGG